MSDERWDDDNEWWDVIWEWELKESVTTQVLLVLFFFVNSMILGIQMPSIDKYLN